MKAILTLNEMPENCEECPLNYDMFTCLFVPHSSTILMDSERLNDCPLKEPPDKLTDNNDYQENAVTIRDNVMFAKGWNACIDAIAGTED